MKKPKKPLKVLFNASVILSGLKSPSGGSGVLLKWSREGVIDAIVSELIINEVAKNISKLRISKPNYKEMLKRSFIEVSPPPDVRQVRKYKNIVSDFGDAHLFASAQELKVDYLVSLDKKHVLSLKKKFRKPKIVNPGELIETLKWEFGKKPLVPS